MIGSVQENELILNRAGARDVQPYQPGRFWICDKYRLNMVKKLMESSGNMLVSCAHRPKKKAEDEKCCQ